MNWQAIKIPKGYDIDKLVPELDEYNAVWNLDESVAPILKSLGTYTCQRICLHGESFYRPYRIRYIPEKVMIIYNGRWALRIYNLERFYPDEPEPETLLELQKKLDAVIEAVKLMDIEPTKLTSPIAIYEKKLKELNLPALGSIPIPASMYAYMCSSKAWIEAYKLGRWQTAYDYDIQSAYPTILATLEDTRDFNWILSDKYESKATYGYTKCIANITKDINPILYENENGLSTPIGKRKAFLTKKQIDFIYKWGIGTVEIVDGWWAVPRIPKIPKLLSGIINDLILLKSHENKVVKNIAKGISVGLYGKFGEMYDNEFGPFFNACWFAETSSQISLQLAEFIYQNKLQDNLIATSVDGLLLDKSISLPTNWRLAYQGEAIVVGDGSQFTNIKRPRGISLVDLKEMINKNPDTGYYEKTIKRPVTLFEAVDANKLQDVGKIVDKVTSVDLYLQEHERNFPELPRTGKQLTSRIYTSTAKELK